MIVLKSTQDKVLAALQSVAGIVERRHTLPILANVLLRKTGSGATDHQRPGNPDPHHRRSSTVTTATSPPRWARAS
jgi:hypothetical protein